MSLWTPEIRRKALESFAAHNGPATDCLVLFRLPDGRWTGQAFGETESRSIAAGALLQAILEDLSSGHYGDGPHPYPAGAR